MELGTEEAVLDQMATAVIDWLALTYIEIMNEVNLSQIFIWFQEKTIIGAEILMHNPTPGLNFRAADLVRNLILASYMKRSLVEQEALYRKYWFLPLEKHLGPRMDQMLQKFLNLHLEPSLILDIPEK
jgi:hypothetical protein